MLTKRIKTLTIACAMVITAWVASPVKVQFA